MAKISETELQRRLRSLENKTGSSLKVFVSAIDPSGTDFVDGDEHYNSATGNLYIFSSGAWVLSAKKLHIMYATVANNLSTAGIAPTQISIEGFSALPFESSGIQKKYMGMWLGGVDASTDPTDYTWTLTAGEAGSNVRVEYSTDGADGTWVTTQADDVVYAYIRTCQDTNGDGVYVCGTSSKFIPEYGVDYNDGGTVAQITIYKRSATALATPTGGQYAFATRTLTAPTGWASSIPTGTDPVYSCITMAHIIGNTATDTTLTWSSPESIISDGVAGLSVYTTNVFHRSTTAPGTPVSDTGSFAFGTNLLSEPTGNPSTQLWTRGIPSGTDPLYASEATFSVSGGTGTDSTVDWGTPRVVSQNGETGLDGLSTYLFSVFTRASTAPTTPINGSYNFTTNTPTAPAGVPSTQVWSTSVPSGTDPLYISTTLASTAGPTGTDTTFTWSTPVIMARDGYNPVKGTDYDDGIAGNNIRVEYSEDGTTGSWVTTQASNTTYYFIRTCQDTNNNGVYVCGLESKFIPEKGVEYDDGGTVAQITIYRRSSTALSNPTGGSYNFGNKTLTPPTGWTSVVPTGTDPVYSSVTLASIVGNTGTDSTLTWSNAELTFSNGITGKSVYTANVYLRSSVTPGTPTGGSFDFGANTLVAPTRPTGSPSAEIWLISIPTTGSDPIYASEATFSIAGDTGTDNTVTWGAPRIVSKDGVPGLSTYLFSVYQRSATLPTAPTGGQYNFTTNTPTAPSGWFISAPSSSVLPTLTNPLYVTTALASTSGPTGIDSTLTWGTPTVIAQDGYTPVKGTDYNDGNTVAQLTIHKRSPTTLSNPTGGSYNFSNKTLAPPTGWTTAIPTGTDPVYSSVTIAEIVGTTGTDTTLTWTNAEITISNGLIGKSVYTTNVYLRSSVTPGTPTGGSFNFGNNTLTAPTRPTGSPSTEIWLISIPAIGSDPIYSSEATFSISGDTGTDSTVTWGSPRIVSKDGDAGLSTYLFSVFLRSSVVPGTPTGGQYNFTNNTPTAPTLPSGSPSTEIWFTSIPSGSDPLYVSTTLASTPGPTGIDTSLTWVAPTILAQDGYTPIKDTDYSDGTSSYLHIKYSNDGINFTPIVSPYTTLGETPGSWIGTLVDQTIADSLTFSDYTWKEIVGEDGLTYSFERWYSTIPGLMSQMGVPVPTSAWGTGVTWVQLTGTPIPAAPATAYWIAERYTLGSGTPSDWQLHPVQAKDGGIPFVTGDQLGSTMPTLGDATWITHAVAAVSAFTGRTYSNQKEFGYGTTVVITYSNGKLSGRYVRTVVNNNWVDTWVAPASFIDGDLIVDGSIAAAQISATAINSTHLVVSGNDAINYATVGADALGSADVAEANAIHAGLNIDLVAATSSSFTIGVSVDSNKIIKGNSGSSGWVDSVYSVQSYTDGAAARCEIQSGTWQSMQFAFGLNSNPSSNHSYTTLDYALYAYNASWYAYENNVQYSISAAPPSVGQRLSIEYDGSTVRYYINDSLVRSVAASSNQQLYVDSAFLTGQPVTLKDVALLSMTDIKSATNTSSLDATSKVTVVTDNIYTAGSTTIDGGKVTTGSITAAVIAAGTITANEIATDAISANMVTTGTGNDRIEITNTVISVYNGGVLRVKIGAL